MSSGTPEVLVVLPTLGDRLEQLEDALLSVTNQRKDLPLTLVVAVPAGAKKARALAKAHGAVIVNDPSKGMSDAINAGLATRTTEEFYIWLGDDDSYRPGGLRRLVSLLRRHPEALVAYGGCDYVDANGDVLWSSRAGALAALLIGYGPNLVPHPAALMRWEAVQEVGGYDESLRLVMDLDVLLRLKRRGRFVSTREVVSTFGWHPQSLTVQDRIASEREARMVKRKYLGPVSRVFEPLWEYPVAWASRLAARQLGR